MSVCVCVCALSVGYYDGKKKKIKSKEIIFRKMLWYINHVAPQRVVKNTKAAATAVW